MGLITFPTGKAGIVPLTNLIQIFSDLFDRVVLITGNEGSAHFKTGGKLFVHGLAHKRGAGVVDRLARYLMTQAKISMLVARHTNDVRTWVLFSGGGGLIFPMLAAKLTGKRVIMAFAGSDAEMLQSANDAMHLPLRMLSRMNCSLSDGIILYSPHLIDQWQLGRWSSKVRYAHEHFIDFDKFQVMTPFQEREMMVGYIGRFTREKGAVEFAQTIPLVLKDREVVRFLIAGDGVGREDIERIVKDRIGKEVQMVGWIPHDLLPDYLNRLRLLVLPSTTEGLPNIMLEALSCGTPVLVTPVGSIPGIIKESENGFILKERTPDAMAAQVIKVLDSPDLEKVASNGHSMVKKEFAYQTALDTWRTALL